MKIIMLGVICCKQIRSDKDCDGDMIEVIEIEKHFSDQTIIYPLNLTIHEGEFLTILGPSGCGKTTLLRMIAGFEQVTKGDILLDGKKVTDVPPYLRDVNMVFQHYALFPHMTVEQNIGFGLQMKKVPTAEQKKRIAEAVALTRLGELIDRKPTQLSGGQQQRVAIARAIVNNPKVLLLDEPLGALDLQLRKDLQIELKHLQKKLGITFVYVTHDQEEAMAMSDRIVVMNGGRVEQIGTPFDIYHNPKSLFVATFIGENNIFQKGEQIFAVRPEKIVLNQIDMASSGGRSYKKSGKVEDIVFLGNMYKLFIKLDEDQTVLLAYQQVNEKHRFKEGEPVAIGWADEDEVILG